ncbi:hypothetical protein BI350_01430 [Sporosarcina ureilytica]|uniref:Uncharacterized protein n=1 Tax=Sporosarcina ureilytica TaxID=298596 RepID=A0A1D8JCG2_9BACL|nr:hypothetical protein BI350_01430 [Sporosarcina ureilytica]
MDFVFVYFLAITGAVQDVMDLVNLLMKLMRLVKHMISVTNYMVTSVFVMKIFFADYIRIYTNAPS